MYVYLSVALCLGPNLGPKMGPNIMQYDKKSFKPEKEVAPNDNLY